MRRLRVIFAVGREEERRAIAELAQGEDLFGETYFPLDVAAVERIFSEDAADAIVTDFSFHSGAFADWLTFWPLPTVLLTDPGDDLERIEHTLSDEASTFLERDPEGRYLAKIPLHLRKILNIRESITRQNAHIQMTERQYLNLLQAIPDIVYILDDAGRFIFLNDSIRSLGFDPAKLIGKHFSEIIHPTDVPKVSRAATLPDYLGRETGPENAPKLFDERRTGNRMTRNLELRLRRNIEADGYVFASVTAYGEINSTGYDLPEYASKGAGSVGIIRDISIRKEHEQALLEALAAKEVLLKEIHHRVKNNLQVVSSLLNLQENAVEDEVAREVFLDCQTQIQSMAMVHEVLYRSENFEGVDMQAYFERLLDYLMGVYESASRRVSAEVCASSVVLELDSAIPIALIVNELVSNSFKHAFPEERPGKITIRMSQADSSWLLEVSDDGIGTEAAKQRCNTRGGGIGTQGLGTELIQALTAQLRGSLSRSGPPGLVSRIRFPRKN